MPTGARDPRATARLISAQAHATANTGAFHVHCTLEIIQKALSLSLFLFAAATTENWRPASGLLCFIFVHNKPRAITLYGWVTQLYGCTQTQTSNATHSA